MGRQVNVPPDNDLEHIRQELARKELEAKAARLEVEAAELRAKLDTAEKQRSPALDTNSSGAGEARSQPKSPALPTPKPSRFAESAGPTEAKTASTRRPATLTGSSTPALRKPNNQPTDPEAANGKRPQAVVAEQSADEDDDDAGASEPSRWETWRQYISGKLAGGVGASMLFHAVLLVVLALIAVVLQKDEPEMFLVAATSETETFEELEPLEMVVEEFDDQESAMPTEMSVGSIESDLVGMQAAAPTGIEAAPLGSGLLDVAGVFGGDGLGTGAKGKSMTKFFGIPATGNRFVYVVDNSKSMKNGRFEKACYEMIRSIEELGPKQKFYVVFFSDRDYPLFYPRTAPGLTTATAENKRMLRAWVSTVPLLLKTNAKEAVKRALSLRPDAIYLLTDGKFTDNTEKVLLGMDDNRIPIHTVGFEDRRGEVVLKRISKKHHGIYRFVE